MTVTPTLRMVYHMTRFTIELFLSPEFNSTIKTFSKVQEYVIQQ